MFVFPFLGFSGLLIYLAVCVLIVHYSNKDFLTRFYIGDNCFLFYFIFVGVDVNH